MKKGRNLTFLIILFIFALCFPAEASLDEEIIEPIKEVIKEDIKDLNWTSVSEGQFDYYYYKGDIKDIYLVRRAFQNAFPKIKSYLRSSFSDRIKVLIFPGEESLRKYFKKPLQDKDLSGLSFPEDLIMMIPLKGDNIPSDFIAVHELTHLIFKKTLLPYEPSLWIDEGIASYFGVHHIISPYRVVLPSYFNEIALTADFISLKDLIEVESFMELDDIGLDLFYMETLSFMEFFNNEFGEAKFQLLLDSLKTGASDKSALRYSTGLEIDELDRIWRTNLSGKSEEDTARALQVIEENKEGKNNKRTPEELVIYVFMITSIMLIAGFGVAYFVRRYLLE